MSLLSSILAQSDSNGAGGAGLAIGLIILFVVIGIAAFVFWLWMLVDVLKSSKSSNDKLLWALVIVLTGVLGALVYFFVARSGTTNVTGPPA